MPSNILGVNYFYHDTSACVVCDGVLVAALEEERFSREKHTWGFPYSAIENVLAAAGLEPGDVTDVAVSIEPRRDWHRKLLFAPRLGRRVRPFVRHELFRAVRRERELRGWWRATFDADGPSLHRVAHHLAHGVGSFLASGLESAAVLSIDGSGEWSTTWLGEGDPTGARGISESYFPHSLGLFYEAATEFCGFRPNYDEGKTMGLAPYGDPERFAPAMRELVRVDPSGRVRVDTRYFDYPSWSPRRCGERYYAAFGAPRRPGDEIESHHMDVAAAAQRVLEERVLEMCRVLEAETTSPHVVVAGGVALNSVMNGRILRETRFRDVYALPAPGDNGTSIGAAYCVHDRLSKSGRSAPFHDPFLGTSYDDDRVEALLREYKLPYRRSSSVCSDTARLLREGKLVGWFQGRMEVGPRALGNRSILCDPTGAQVKDKINREVKHREGFRPFAPAAPVESASRYFEIEVATPFMLKVCSVRPEHRDAIPAVVHVDGSARLQTVDRVTNPRFHRLLVEFEKLSGVPVLLNTSFNVQGEPIVESPTQAIRCFFTTGLDALVLGDFVVEKRMPSRSPATADTARTVAASVSS